MGKNSVTYLEKLQVYYTWFTIGIQSQVCSVPGDLVRLQSLAMYAQGP